MKIKRNSNVEILRILSMLFIVISHYSVHNGVLLSSLNFGLNKYLLEITNLGNIGVIIFVLITGYFSIEQTEIKLKKLVSLYLQVLFYSIGIYFVLLVIGKESFSIVQLIKSVFPITFKEYWFLSVYTLIYILSPFINKFLNNLNKHEYVNYLFVSLLIFSILPTITSLDFYANYLIQFILFYSLGAFFKRFPNNKLIQNKRINICIFILSLLVLLASPLLFDILATKSSFFLGKSVYLFNRTSIVAICFSVSLFVMFISKKVISSNIINNISACVFGIYLIHDNNFMRKILWIDLFKNADFVNSNLFILHFIISVLAVFGLSLLIEFIRKNTIEKYTTKLLNKNLDKLQEILKLKYQNLCKLFLG